MNKPLKTEVKPYKIRELKPDSFIFEIENALTPDICKEIINRFENSKALQYQGRIGQLADSDQSIKKSTDLAASASKDWKDIDQILHHSLGLAFREFRKKFTFFNGPFKDMGYNIQRTQPGEHYHWHIDGGSHDFSHRQLVIIWYLNDVDGPGGETEFLFQDVKVTPREGKMVMFPPFWTHEHRGVTLQSGVKYIATTWLVFA